MATTKTKHRKTSKGIQVRQSGLAARVALVDSQYMRTDFPDFKPGDTVKVHAKIKEGEKERIQIYEGVVIAMGNQGGSRSFCVRKISHGVGVERIFLFTSQKIAKVEIAQVGRVRRAKLYYLRGLEGKAAKIEREMDHTTSNAASGVKETPSKKA